MAKRVTEYEEHGFTHGRERRPFPWPNNEEHGWTHGKEAPFPWTSDEEPGWKHLREHRFIGLITKSTVGRTVGSVVRFLQPFFLAGYK